MRKKKISNCKTLLYQCKIIVYRALTLALVLGLWVSCSSRHDETVIDGAYVVFEATDNHFPLASNGAVAPIFISIDDHKGAIRAASDFQKDVERVTGILPALETEVPPTEGSVVIIGTVGKSPLIDQLVTKGKFNVKSLKGKWEKFIIQTVLNPFPGVDQALVIAGSDMRGTIYGIYDLSYQIGVSPWYFWADVPVVPKSELHVMPGRYTLGEPAVRYRGIFINNEQPALGGWVAKTYGGFNSQFYQKVFELILRLRGNYLWPAMWGQAFYVQDSLNGPLAHEWGIVISKTHHEPMGRAHVEWRWYGEGEWNYLTNKEVLQEFWREGVRRQMDYETILSMGMRGDGDEPMTEETAIELLEKIISDQRQIIEEVTGKPAHQVPQFWALYKEVQDYYDKGMRVPDDVMLLFCNDNWGNVRRLPRPDYAPRKGGYGMYYHFDYVGGPRNYKWLNTNPIARVWEQMHLTYRWGANELWLVNVGDIKPMEFPIEFFLDLAWNPNKWGPESTPEYTLQWAKRKFPDEFAPAVAEFISTYTKFNGRRKPELLYADTYSITDYREAERVRDEYNALTVRAREVYNALPQEFRDAYYQLVMYPIEASATVNELYVTTALNRLYAKQGRAATNAMAQRAKHLFERDAQLSRYFNDTLANGKWAHMMDQTRIGYTYWQQPPVNSMPRVETLSVPPKADLGVAIEGSASWWPNAAGPATLPEFDPFHNQDFYIEVFNRGRYKLNYAIGTAHDWVKLSTEGGDIELQERVFVTIDWDRAPKGRSTALVTVNGAGSSVTVQVPVNNPESPTPADVLGFVESNGYVAMEAQNYTRAVGASGIYWQTIPGLGKTLSGVTPFPVTSQAQTPGGASPCLEYRLNLFSQGEVKVHAYLSPTLNYHSAPQGLRYAVSFNDEAPQVVYMHEGEDLMLWEKWVANNINIKTSTHTINQPGVHTLRFWMVDPGVVLQRLVVETTGVKPSYLGPPESFRR